MNTELIQMFRDKIEKGCVIGPFMKTCDPAFVEAAGYAGMDFAILDMEHGPISLENMQNNIRAAQIAGILPIVRVGNYELIAKALDIGAAGVQVPQVSPVHSGIMSCPHKPANAPLSLGKIFRLPDHSLRFFCRAHLRNLYSCGSDI